MKHEPRVRLKDRRRRAFGYRAVVAGVLLVVVLVATAYAARLPQFTVSTVVVTGVQSADQAAIQKVAEDALAGSYFFLFPKRMSFVVPTKAVSEKIQNSFSQVAKAHVQLTTFNTLTVTIEERSGTATWCSTECYTLDKNGLVFEKATATSTRRYEGTLTGKTADDPIGGTFLPNVFALLDAFITRVEGAIHERVTTVAVSENGDVFATLLSGGEVRFVMATNTAPILDNIASVFASSEFKRDTQLEYADFRFSGKALVKFAK